MGLLDKLFPQIFQKKSERIAINTFTGAGEITLLGIGGKQFIEDGYKSNPQLFSIINWIIKRTSRVKWQLFDVTNPEEKVEIFDHDYLTLINKPNPFQSKREFYEALTGYKKITGEVFVHGVAPQAGVNMGIPQELWVIPTPIVVPKFNSVGVPDLYEIRSAVKTETIPTEEMMYLKEFNPGSGNRGLSMIEAGVKTVTMSNDTYEANMRLLQNSGAKGILSLDDDNASATQEQVDLIEEKLNRKQGGPSKYGKAHVSSLKWNWQSIGLSAKDLVLIESHGLNLQDMCNLAQLPTELFNDKSASTFNNVQEARKTGITDAVIPENDAIRDGFNMWLTPTFEKRDKKKYVLDHDTRIYPELQKNMKELVDWLNVAWWFTGNQKLEQMDMPQSDNPVMSEILLPTSLIPSGEPEELEKAYQRLNAIKDKQSNVA